SGQTPDSRQDGGGSVGQPAFSRRGRGASGEPRGVPRVRARGGDVPEARGGPAAGGQPPRQAHARGTQNDRHGPPPANASVAGLGGEGALSTNVAEPLTIRCRENGPLVIAGPVRVVDHHGNEFPLPTGKASVALCRCGRSGTKPFCDGSH